MSVKAAHLPLPPQEARTLPLLPCPSLPMGENKPRGGVNCLKSLSKWRQELGQKARPTSPHFLPLASPLRGPPRPWPVPSVRPASLPPGSDECRPHRLDRDLNRLPQDLYHARCLCPHCVSLQTGSHMDPLGNSELLYHNQTVFYRRPCPGEPGAHDGYCLEQRLYRVSLACVCVRPRVMA